MKIPEQKRLALVNDVTGFGRCSCAVEVPLISALKVQACVLPTAILPVHTEFPTYAIDDYTLRMEAYIECWKKNHLTFHGISTGFMSSVAQIDIVLSFIHQFKGDDMILIVDPVMGDNGKLYDSYTEDICNEMKRLIPYADVITPNLTELCQLASVPYPKETPSMEWLQEMAEKIAHQGPKQIVVTGIHRNGLIDNFIYDKGRIDVVTVQKVARDRAGTGDAFSAIVSASIVKGERLYDAVKKATDFISKALIYTDQLELPTCWGLAFEEYLTELR